MLTIEQGDTRATIDPRGARLARLRHAGVDLVTTSWDPDPEAAGYAGFVIAPWPNRIPDGRYTFAGTTHQLPVNEPARATALHGLTCTRTWDVAGHSADVLELQTTLAPQDGWPFRIDLALTTAVDSSGLRLDLRARNSGSDPAPYGCTIHPYLRAPTGTVDDWTLDLPARTVLEVTAERLLPVRTVPVDGTIHDLRGGVSMADRALDHAWTDLATDDLATATLRGPDGRGTEMTWDPVTLPWVQVFNQDPARAGVAVEPMSCPPDAYNSGRDLVVLEPGADHHAWWHIGPVMA